MTILRFLRLSAHIQMLPILESGEETLVGGQAVMEGVMMRAPHSYCVAVRKANGEIVTEEQPIQKVSEKYPLFKKPVLRGLGTLGQAMTLGYKALKFSANAALDETPAKPQGEAASVTAPAAQEEKKPAEISNWMMTGNLIFSLGFFIFLYKLIPLFLATQLGKAVPSLSGRFATNMTDGVIRMVIFLTFLFLLSLMKDIRRVFEYHGAEHKVVFNYESGRPVNIENAQTFTTFHPRCGTSFLLVVMTISMIVYALVPVDGFLPKFLARIALLPVITGVSYELIRFAAKRQGTLMGLLSIPGLWLQRITTKPPDNSEAAVAIRALEGAMELEKSQGGELVIA
ncbi:MAG: DUF1385 domain-containing protein [Bryobacteraceae bacterium]